jgi:hypothetical protein
MDPQLKSYITSMALAAGTAIAAAAATRGYITPDQQGALATGLVTLGGAAVAWAVAEYKRRQTTPAALVQSLNKTADGPKALIQAVNAGDNGVTAVATVDAKAAGIPAVSAPLK